MLPALLPDPVPLRVPHPALRPDPLLALRQGLLPDPVPVPWPRVVAAVAAELPPGPLPVQLPDLRQTPAKAA